MKKTIKLIAILAIIMLFVTGCGMRSNVGVEVAKNKTVTLKIISAMDNEMIDYYLGMQNGDSEGTTYTDEQRWAYVESSTTDSNYEEFTKEKYDQDGYKGYVYSIELGKIDDLLAEDSEVLNIDDISKDSKLFTKDGDTYVLNLDLKSADISEAQSYKDYGAEFDLSFYVTLPNKAIENNATTVSENGKTYSWDLLQAENANIKFKIDGGLFGGSNNTLPIILGIVAAVIVIAVIIVVVVVTSKKNKTKKAQEPENNEKIEE